MIVDDVTNHDKYFRQKPDAAGRIGLHPIQKISSTLQMLAYGGAANANNKYIQISESTSLESLNRFCEAIIEVYGEEYLQQSQYNQFQMTLVSWGGEGVCSNARLSGLYALGVEKLPNSMGWEVHRKRKGCLFLSIITSIMH